MMELTHPLCLTLYMSIGSYFKYIVVFSEKIKLISIMQYAHNNVRGAC